MSDLFSGKSGLFAFLLVLLVMIVSVVVKYFTVVSIKPAAVHAELQEIFISVEDVRPLSLLKANFLMEWGKYRDSDECSSAVSASRLSSGFVGDIYTVSYTDSIEFPGLPTFHCQFSLEQPMGRRD